MDSVVTVVFPTVCVEYVGLPGKRHIEIGLMKIEMRRNATMEMSACT